MSKKISQLPTTGSVNAADEFEIVQGGTSKRVTADKLPSTILTAALAASSGASLVGFVNDGSGAAAETVQSALRNLRAGISTDTVFSRFYRADQTFSGTVDPGTFLGYNLTGFGQIEDVSKASIMFGMEADFNTGSIRGCELHLNLAVPGGSFKRPFYSFLAITGANAGDILDTNVLSDVNMLISAPTMTITSTTLALSGTVEHTGSFLTSSFIFQTNNNSDGSSLVQIGAGGDGQNPRTNVRWRNGGLAAPSNTNALSDGDKTTFWNASILKDAMGLDTDGTRWFQHNGSAAANGYVWYGGLTATPAEHMRLNASGNLGLGATAFGTNAAGVFSVKNGTAPTTGPADTVQFYSSDNSAGNTIPSFFCEGTEVIATGQADSASSVRVKMRINGTVVTLLAI